MADKVLKGRTSRTSHVPGALDAISVRHRKLTDEDLREAHLRHQAGDTLRVIGRSLGVSHTTLSRALRGIPRYTKIT